RALQLGADRPVDRALLRQRHRAEEGGYGMTSHRWMEQHAREVDAAMTSVQSQVDTIERWGRVLAERLSSGARLLAAGNGGSAAEAQHLTGELVGRFLDDRRPFAAVSLCSDSSTMTCVVNDYGADELFARQVQGHGQIGRASCRER